MDFMKNMFTARLSDTVMTDVMIDIETTGTNPQYGNMIQLAAVQFNYDTGEIGPSFDRCLATAPNRFWSDGTRTWWLGQKKEILAGILDRMEDPLEVMQAYQQFILNSGRKLRFWSRGSFDWAFVSSYCEQYSLEMPHNFWEARDLRTFLAGLRGTASEPDMKWCANDVKGDKHNALFDVVVQLKQLFNAKEGIFHEILPPLAEGEESPTRIDGVTV